MDPKANVSEQVELAERIQGVIDGGVTPNTDDVDRLTELVLALHEWRTSGGFDPYVLAAH